MRRVTEAEIEQDLAQASATRYVPDLQSLLSVCEFNFQQIKRLIPEFRKGDVHQWLIDRPGGQVAQVAIEVQVCSRYTVDLYIRQQLVQVVEGMPSKLNWVVRMYEDTRMAEVLTFQCIYAREGSHSYPNQNMLQRDEKRQANEFLKEWLGYYAVHGRTSVSVGEILGNALDSREDIE